jgi:hypothetical protein
MSFAPTFGSVGDFIAISILIKDAVTALDDAKGSASEYHQLIRELLSLERAFLEVGMLCQTTDPSPEIIAISIQIRRITDQCKSCLEGFLGPIYEYTKSFRPGGSGNKLRDAIRKIRWRFEKDKIITFHNEITTHGMAIAILLQAANTCETNSRDSAYANNCLGGFCVSISTLRRNILYKYKGPIRHCPTCRAERWRRSRQCSMRIKTNSHIMRRV